MITNYYIFKIQDSRKDFLASQDEFMKKQSAKMKYENQVNLLFEKEKFDSVIIVCNEYANSNPDRSEFAFYDIAQAYQGKEKKDSAIYFFTKAINKSASYVNALVNRAWTYYDMAEYEKAEQDLIKATYYRSDFFYDLGVIQEKLDKQKAIKSYNSFIRDNKDSLFCVKRRDSLLGTIKNGL